MIRAVILVILLSAVLFLLVIKGNNTLRPALAARRAARRLAKFDPAAYGLPPRSQVSAERPGPPRADGDQQQRIREMAERVWAGDWKVAAEYVAEAGQDWEERWSRISLLRELAEVDAAWLDAWRAAEPGDGTPVTVHAAHLLHEAWRVRGSGYANQTSESARAGFKAMLPASVEVAEAAAELSPADPSPWIVMITAVRGLDHSHEQFRQLWENLTARAPFHVEAHWQALQFWCAKWSGSNELMMQFATATLSRAPQGSALPGVYLQALHELEKRQAALRSDRSTLPVGREAVQRLTTVATALSALPADQEQLPYLRHLLAHYLLQARQFDAALEQFRLIGPWCGSYPWSERQDPVAAFDEARATAALHSSAPRSH